MDRKSIRQKGYDCRNGKCQHTPKGDHGIFGGAWCFIVTDGPVAVSLEVLTSFYPETVSSDGRQAGWPAERHRLIGSVVYHRATPTADDTTGQPCEFVPGGRCYGCDRSYLAADEFLPLLSDTFEDQPEAMWKRLEEMAAQFRAGVES